MGGAVGANGYRLEPRTFKSGVRSKHHQQMNRSRRTPLETFERLAAILFAIALPATVVLSLIDPDEKSLFVAGGLIVNIVVFTAWMIASSINQRRRIKTLSEILSQITEEESGNSGTDHLP